MQCLKKLTDYNCDKETAITFGKFDGLHEGHMLLVNEVARLAKKDHLNSVVFAIDMHNFWKAMGVDRQVLMTKYERFLHLDGVVDQLISCPFDLNFSLTEPEDFVENIICGLFHARYVVVGPDFCFGKNASGNIELLKKLSPTYGYELIVIEKKRCNHHVISSSYIRETLKEGNVELVNKMLGYPFEVSGKVVHGKQLGRTLGFPTLNVMWPKEKVVPPRGVYLADVHLAGKCYHSVANIGVKPTVSDEQQVSIESFLLDYNGNAYDQNVRIELLKFKRQEQKFDSVEQMKEQVDEDILYAKEYFA